MNNGFLCRTFAASRGCPIHEETISLQNRPWVRPEDILGIADRKPDPAPLTHSDNLLPLEQVQP